MRHASIPMLNTHIAGEGMLYYSINPVQNEVYQILSDLAHFKLHISNLTKTLRERKLLQFPELMKNVQFIIEFTDCILRARDLMSY